MVSHSAFISLMTLINDSKFGQISIKNNYFLSKMGLFFSFLGTDFLGTDLFLKKSSNSFEISIWGCELDRITGKLIHGKSGKFRKNKNRFPF